VLTIGLYLTPAELNLARRTLSSQRDMIPALSRIYVSGSTHGTDTIFIIDTISVFFFLITSS
jgi:hypothetical protein